MKFAGNVRVFGNKVFGNKFFDVYFEKEFRVNNVSDIRMMYIEFEKEFKNKIIECIQQYVTVIKSYKISNPKDAFIFRTEHGNVYAVPML